MHNYNCRKVLDQVRVTLPVQAYRSLTHPQRSCDLGVVPALCPSLDQGSLVPLLGHQTCSVGTVEVVSGLIPRLLIPL
jgi:hypothetical protein